MFTVEKSFSLLKTLGSYVDLLPKIKTITAGLSKIIMQYEKDGAQNDKYQPKREC